MKKILMIVGLFLGLLASRADAANYYTTRSTGVLISSGTGFYDQFNVIAVRLSTANAGYNGNTIPYVVLLETNSAAACQPDYEVAKAISPPIYFSSGTFAPGSGNIAAPPDYLYTFPGRGVTVSNLVLCQPVGNASGVTAGMVTIYTAPAPSRRSEQDPW